MTMIVPRPTILSSTNKERIASMAQPPAVRTIGASTNSQNVIKITLAGAKFVRGGRVIDELTFFSWSPWARGAGQRNRLQ